jgi:hypothetical protein
MVFRKISLVYFIVLSFICDCQIPTYIPLDSLNAFYPFTQNVTNLNDESANFYNGTTSQSILFGYDRNGQSSQAIYGSGYIDLPGMVMNFNYDQSFSISFWCIKSNSLILSETLFSSAQVNDNFEIEYNGLSNEFSFLYGGNSNSLHYQILDTSWHHFTYVYNQLNSIAQLFVDGELQSGTTIFGNQILQYGNFVRIGAKANLVAPTSCFTGKYDDFGFWKRVLNPCEIRSIYHDQFQFSYLSAGNDIGFCNGQDGVLVAENAFQAFWNNGVLNGIPFQPTNGYYVVSGLDYNECPGTDSIYITIYNNDVTNVSLTSCDPVIYHDLLLEFSGSYQTTLNSIHGCDSVIYIQFERFNAPLITVPNIVGNFLFAEQNSTFTYQWFNCENDLPILGATEYLFEVLDSTAYFVIVNNSCGSDTSDCISLFPDVGISEYNQMSINIYPNPAENIIYLSGLSLGDSYSFQILNEFGQICKEGQINNSAINITSLPIGLYLLQIEGHVFEIIKKNRD